MMKRLVTPTVIIGNLLKGPNDVDNTFKFKMLDL